MSGTVVQDTFYDLEQHHLLLLDDRSRSGPFAPDVADGSFCLAAQTALRSTIMDATLLRR